MDTRRLFFQHIAQTSEEPLAIQIKKAEGTRLCGMIPAMNISI